MWAGRCYLEGHKVAAARRYVDPRAADQSSLCVLREGHQQALRLSGICHQRIGDGDDLESCYLPGVEGIVKGLHVQN